MAFTWLLLTEARKGQEIIERSRTVGTGWLFVWTHTISVVNAGVVQALPYSCMAA